MFTNKAIEEALVAAKLGQANAAAKHLLVVLTNARNVSDSDLSRAHLCDDGSVLRGIDVRSVATGGIEHYQADRHQDGESDNYYAACSFQSGELFEHYLYLSSKPRIVRERREARNRRGCGGRRGEG